MGAYPTPYNPSTNIIFQTPADGLYKILVTDILGRTCAEINKELTSGVNRFELGGGAAGIYIVSVIGEDYAQSLKVVNLGGGTNKFILRLVGGGNNLAKRASVRNTYSSVEIRLEFTAEHYQPKTEYVTLDESNPYANLDVTMDPIFYQYAGTLSGDVKVLGTNTANADANVKAEIDGEVFETTTDASGRYSLDVDVSRTFFEPDVDIHLVYSEDGFVTKDTVITRNVNNLSAEIDAFMEAINNNFNFTFYVMNPLREPVVGFDAVRFTVDGVNYDYISDAQGKVDVEIDGNATTAELRVNDSDYQSLFVVSPQNKGATDLNIYQNGRLPNNNPDNPVTVSLPTLDSEGTMILYVLEKQYDGRDMESAEVQRILGNRGQGETTSFMNDVNDPVYFAVVGWYNETPNVSDVPQSAINEGLDVMNLITPLLTGVNTEVVYIQNKNDPIWQNVSARTQDICYIEHQKVGGPGNSLFYEYATNGLVKLRKGLASFTVQSSVGVKIEEAFQSALGVDDPNRTSNLGPWIWTYTGLGNNVSDFTMTDFAKWIAAYVTSVADNQKYQE